MNTSSRSHVYDEVIFLTPVRFLPASPMTDQRTKRLEDMLNTQEREEALGTIGSSAIVARRTRMPATIDHPPRQTNQLTNPDSHHFWFEPIPHECRLPCGGESDPFLAT